MDWDKLEKYITFALSGYGVKKPDKMERCTDHIKCTWKKPAMTVKVYSIKKMVINATLTDTNGWHGVRRIIKPKW